jgi:hypothetical protein
LGGEKQTPEFMGATKHWLVLIFSKWQGCWEFMKQGEGVSERPNRDGIIFK